MRLTGKIAVVVGAGQSAGAGLGNGRATSILFARHGARVLLVDRDEASARQTQAMIADEGHRADVCRADAASENDCRIAIDTALSLFGRIDILHNNVGIGSGDSDPLHVEEAAWDSILSVNLKSALFACKHAVPVMREQKSGSIINVSSLAATAAAVELTAYKVSKAGLNALTQSLAIANAPFGIRVNAIAPGLIETPMAIEGISRNRGVAAEDLIRERNARVPLRARWARPGMWPTPRYFWRPMKPTSSQASSCRSTAAKERGSARRRCMSRHHQLQKTRLYAANHCNGVGLHSLRTTRCPVTQPPLPRRSIARDQWPRLERPRIAPAEKESWNDAQKSLLEPIEARGRLYNVHKTIANHPRLLSDWLTFATYILRDNTLPVRDREILILRIGYLCHAEYELAQHARIGKRTGLTDDDLRRIAQGPTAEGLNEHEQLLLSAVDELHADAFVSQKTWDALSATYNTQQMMDLVFTVGEYNMVSMALNSFGVQFDDDLEPFPE